MKKSVGMFLASALVMVGSAWAQTTPAAPAMDQSRFMVLAGHIQGVAKLLETQGSFTQEQAQQLLPYFRAIRNTAAMTPVMADWYVRNLDQRFTAEQRSALGGEAAMAPAETAPADTNTQTNTTPEAAGAANPPAGGEGAGAGGTTTPTDTNAQQPAPAAPTDTSTQPPATGIATDTNAQQPAAPATAEAAMPASDIKLDLEAANPFNQAPIVESLDALIAKLTELARG